MHDKHRAHSTPWRLLGRVPSPKVHVRSLFFLKVKFREVICSDEDSGAIYYTETYDENMMGVFRIRVGLCCRVLPSESRATKIRKLRTSEGMKPQMQVTNDVNPCHDLLASAV